MHATATATAHMSAAATAHMSAAATTHMSAAATTAVTEGEARAGGCDQEGKRGGAGQ
jgi:hypothetical protein